MSNIRKLSAFRQLSLNCSPTPEQRRKTLRKQFSEDIVDYKEKWIDPGIKVSLNTKNSRNFDHPLPVRIAWEENTPELKTEDSVIIKKCKEVRRGSTGRLSKQNSLERNSILHSKQEITERFKPPAKAKEQEKTNLKIFLAHNSKEQVDEFFNNQPIRDAEHYLEKACERPKLIQPLITNNVSNNSKNLFQIRRNFKPKINLTEIAYSPTRTNEVHSSIPRKDTVVVVPLIEKDQSRFEESRDEHVETSNSLRSKENKDDIKPIDSVIIRPSTAASKREKFQKRTSSVFNATIKDSPHSRPPLIRSSSAPTKSERTRQKFSATKRKIKSIKRVQLKSPLGEDFSKVNNKENPKSQKELNRTTAVNGTEVITMVSLVSPAGSDGEEESLEDIKPKTKSKTNSTNAKNNPLAEDKESTKNMSLRKIVKSVSFQQSSIHAIRSFSASFPGRRGSMATALMLASKSTTLSTKVQEKRSTNSNMPDDDERVPKRRLLRSDTQEELNIIRCEEPQTMKQTESITTEEIIENEPNFIMDIKTKTSMVEIENSGIAKVESENQIVHIEVSPDADSEEVDDFKEDAKYKTQKEKQCWDMYCKMKDRGINVSFDTILRGMMTPTEYRISRKNMVIATPEEPDPAC